MSKEAIEASQLQETHPIEGEEPTTATSLDLAKDTDEKRSQDTSQAADEVKKGEVVVVVDGSENGVYPKGLQLLSIAFALYATVVLVSLDQTIVSTAIPTITNEFNSLSDVGWYGSAYFMTSTTLQPLFGRMYSLYSLKWTYLAAVVIFELGSLICAVAQNSSTFIVGRALAGVGTAGAYIGGMTILSTCIEPRQRPMFVGLNGAFYGMGAIAGPLVGGAFTSKVTWRWCFYINLPIGGPVILAMLLFFRPPKVDSRLNLKEKLLSIDWLGTVLALGSIISILLTLQWGGLTHAWNSSVIIGLLIGFGLLVIAFSMVQVYQGDKATIPPRLLKNRTLWSASIVNFCIGAGYFMLAYFIPFYFQSVKGSSAIRSGVQTLPLIVPTITSVVIAGALTNLIGYVNPFMIFGGVLTAVGAGLLHTLQPDSSAGKWIAYQVIPGLGLGLAFMQPFVISQLALKPEDAVVGGSITIFFQTLGGCLFVSIGQAIYQNKFLQGIQTIPGLDVQRVISNGVTGFRGFVPDTLLPQVVVVSNDALRETFTCAIALGCLWTLSTSLLSWKSVKGMPQVQV